MAGAGRQAERALALAAAGKWVDAIDCARASDAPQARVLAAGLEHRETGPALAMEAAARTEVVRMRRALTVLDTIITLSPLLGLLGPVTGMITAFGIMATTGINQPNAITGGVAEALIATAAGLAVAIATLVPYGGRILRDPIYLTRSLRVAADGLRYEKSLLEEWLRAELAR